MRGDRRIATAYPMVRECRGARGSRPPTMRLPISTDGLGDWRSGPPGIHVDPRHEGPRPRARTRSGLDEVGTVLGVVAEVLRRGPHAVFVVLVDELVDSRGRCWRSRRSGDIVRFGPSGSRRMWPIVVVAVVREHRVLVTTLGRDVGDQLERGAGLVAGQLEEARAGGGRCGPRRPATARRRDAPSARSRSNGRSPGTTPRSVPRSGASRTRTRG